MRANYCGGKATEVNGYKYHHVSHLEHSVPLRYQLSLNLDSPQIPAKTPECFSAGIPAGIHKPILKFTWKCEGLHVAKETWKKRTIFLKMVLKQLPIHMQNINVGLSLSLPTKMNSKRTTDLNTTIRPLGEVNTEEKCDGLS